VNHSSSTFPFYLDLAGKEVITLLETAHISSTSEYTDSIGQQVLHSLYTLRIKKKTLRQNSSMKSVQIFV